MPDPPNPGGLLLGTGDVVEGDEAVGKGSIDFEILPGGPVTVVGVDENEVDRTEAASPLQEFRARGISPEKIGLGRQVDREPVRLGPPVVAGRNPLKLE